MFHRSIAYLSVASLFLLSASSTNTMDLNLDLLKSLLLELCPKIDTFIPPITVQEKILDAAEHTQYNLPFKFNPTEAIAESQLGQLGGCSVHYQDPASSDSHIIHTTYGADFRCLGPCKMKQPDEICLLRNKHDYIVRSLQPGDCPDPWEEEKNDMRFGYYSKLSHVLHGYLVDIDNKKQTLYTALSDGSIFEYEYNQGHNSHATPPIKPPLPLEIQDKLYEGEAIESPSAHRDVTVFAIQFNHTQPDILLVRHHRNTTAYSVVHRPTNCVQFFQGQEIKSDGTLNIFPLLTSTSESRLRLFGDNVGVKLVTVTPHISCCTIRTLLLVKSAQTLWEQWQGTALDKQAAHEIIAAFKTLIPQSADRYFYVWCSKHENGTYALSELYNAQK